MSDGITLEKIAAGELIYLNLPELSRLRDLITFLRAHHPR